MSTTGRTKTRPTTIIPEMDEAGPIIRTVRDEARVPAAKQAAVRRPKTILITSDPSTWGNGA
jgi:hypothetical protein